MTGRWKTLIVLVGVFGLVACSGDDDADSGSTTTTATGDAMAGSFEELAGAPADSCPVALGDAVVAAGVDAIGEVTGRVHVPGATAGTDDATAATSVADTSTDDTTVLEHLDGVEVSCFATTGDGDVHLLLLAGRLDEPASTALALLPQLASEADLAVASLDPIADALIAAEPGIPVELPGDSPVAIARASLEGAADAAYLVWSEGLTRDQVNAVATEVDAVLP